MQKPHHIIPTHKTQNSTELSKHIWTLKENDIDHFISWCILSSRSPYNSARKRCNLCFKEKLLIICQPELSSLNKSNELVYCVTIEQSIEIYHILQISIIGVDMSIMYIIHIYIYICSLWTCTLEFMGITEIQGMKRWQKKKNALCIKTKLFILLWLKKIEREIIH